MYVCKVCKLYVCMYVHVCMLVNINVCIIDNVYAEYYYINIMVYKHIY